MIRAAGLGVALVLTILLAGCGIVVTDAAPTDVIQVSAPTLVTAYPEVEALVPASTRALPLGRARQVASRAALGIRVPGCSGGSTGHGFPLDSHTLIADRTVLPGAGSLRISAANRPSTTFAAASVYRVGELGLARVARALPRSLPLARRFAAGASVVVVAERGGKLRLLPGVVVDIIAGAPYGARTNVLRVTSEVREGDAGPVLDAKGQVVAVVFAVDPKTSLGVALPVSALRGQAAGRTLEALDACAD